MCSWQRFVCLGFRAPALRWAATLSVCIHCGCLSLFHSWERCFPPPPARACSLPVPWAESVPRNLPRVLSYAGPRSCARWGLGVFRGICKPLCLPRMTLSLFVLFLLLYFPGAGASLGEFVLSSNMGKKKEGYIFIWKNAFL